MLEATRPQSAEVDAPVPTKIDPPSTATDAPASPDPWQGTFWEENFLFVFPIALFIVFAVFAAVLDGQS